MDDRGYEESATVMLGVRTCIYREFSQNSPRGALSTWVTRIVHVIEQQLENAAGIISATVCDCLAGAPPGTEKWRSGARFHAVAFTPLKK